MLMLLSLRLVILSIPPCCVVLALDDLDYTNTKPGLFLVTLPWPLQITAVLTIRDGRCCVVGLGLLTSGLGG